MRQVKTLSIYAFSTFFNAGVSFITFSFLTHHLTEVDYGIITLYNSFCIFLMPFIGVGVQFILTVDFFKMDAPAFRRQFTNSMAVPLISFLIFTALCFIFYKAIEDFIKVNFFFSVTIPLVCLLTVLYDVFLSLFRNKEKHLLFTGFSVFKSLTEIGFTLLFVIVLGWNWTGRLTGSLLSLVLAGVFIFIVIKRWQLYTGHPAKTEVKSNFLAGLPFVPERLAIFVLGFSDRFFINHYNEIGDVGFYSAGAQIATIVNLVILTLSNTFYPPIFKNLSLAEPNYSKVKSNILLFMGIAAMVTICTLIAIPFFFKYFIGPGFQQGEKYAYLLTVGLFFWSMYAISLAFLMNLRKNRLIMMISISGMIVSLLLNAFNVRNYGAVGATYTNIIVYLFMAVTSIYFVNRYYNLRTIFLGAALPGKAA